MVIINIKTKYFFFDDKIDMNLGKTLNISNANAMYNQSIPIFKIAPREAKLK